MIIAKMIYDGSWRIELSFNDGGKLVSAAFDSAEQAEAAIKSLEDIEAEPFIKTHRR
jgi:hypothetical protein